MNKITFRRFLDRPLSHEEMDGNIAAIYALVLSQIVEAPLPVLIESLNAEIFYGDFAASSEVRLDEGPRSYAGVDPEGNGKVWYGCVLRDIPQEQPLSYRFHCSDADVSVYLLPLDEDLSITINRMEYGDIKMGDGGESSPGGSDMLLLMPVEQALSESGDFTATLEIVTELNDG